MSCALPGDGEPVQRQAGRRELVALVLGGEGVEQDERHRQVQEQRGPPTAASLRPRPAPQSASNAPSRFATVR